MRLIKIFSVLVLFAGGLMLFSTTSASAQQVKLQGDGCELTNYNPDYANEKIVFEQKIACSKPIIGMNLSMSVGWEPSRNDNVNIKYTWHKKCLDVKVCSDTEKVAEPSKGYWYTQGANDYYSNEVAGNNALVVSRVEDFIG